MLTDSYCIQCRKDFINTFVDLRNKIYYRQKLKGKSNNPKDVCVYVIIKVRGITPKIPLISTKVSYPVVKVGYLTTFPSSNRQIVQPEFKQTNSMGH